MNNKIINAILIVFGTLISSFAVEQRGIYSESFINVMIILGVLIIIFGLNNIFRYDEYLRDVFELKQVSRSKTKIILCPKCQKKCRVPVDKTLEIKCPHCSHNWMEIT